jgi:hypothetical protein
VAGRRERRSNLLVATQAVTGREGDGEDRARRKVLVKGFNRGLTACAGISVEEVSTPVEASCGGGGAMREGCVIRMSVMI